MRLDALLHFSRDHLVQGPHYEVEAIDDARHGHHRRYARAAMLDRTADLADVDAEPGEVMLQARFGEHEKRRDVVLARERNGAKVKADREIRKTRSLRCAEALLADRRGRFLFAVPVAVAGDHGEAADFGDGVSGHLLRVRERR